MLETIFTSTLIVIVSTPLIAQKSANKLEQKLRYIDTLNRLISQTRQTGWPIR